MRCAPCEHEVCALWAWGLCPVSMGSVPCEHGICSLWAWGLACESMGFGMWEHGAWCLRAWGLSDLDPTHGQDPAIVHYYVTYSHDVYSPLLCYILSWCVSDMKFCYLPFLINSCVLACLRAIVRNDYRAVLYGVFAVKQWHSLWQNYVPFVWQWVPLFSLTATTLIITIVITSKCYL